MNIGFKSKAERLFATRDYKNALFNYTLALNKTPHDSEARLGVILSDMAINNETEAQAFFNFYTILRSTNNNPEKLIEDMILDFDNFESESNTINSLDFINDIDGISYADFLLLLETTKDFRVVFDNVLFSTKVIISSNDDLYNFIMLLIKYKYHDLAYSYIENFSSNYVLNERMDSLISEIEKG